jgi:hypothetical protein
MSIAHEWGSTPTDRAMDFACDRWLDHADDVMYRAVAVDAPAMVFRWLCQLRVALQLRLDRQRAGRARAR